MLKEVSVITFVILLSSTVESHPKVKKNPIKKVLSLSKDIKKQVVKNRNDMIEMSKTLKDQIVNEIVDAINPTNVGSEKNCDGNQGILQKNNCRGRF